MSSSKLRLVPRNFLFAALTVLLPLLITSCSPIASRRVIDYHVEFEADGQDYRVSATYTCYGEWSYELGDHWFGTASETVIHGALKDGSRYAVLSGKGYPCTGVGRLDVPSTIYVLVSPGPGSVVEGFDNAHDRSLHHRVHIKQSFMDFKEGGMLLESSVRKIMQGEAPTPDFLEYQTVGAKQTPFSDVEAAKRDFYKGECPTRQDIRAQLGCTDAVFNFHPVDAVISNTEASTTFGGHTFNVTMGRSSEASIWFADPSVVCHQLSCGERGPGNSFQREWKQDILVNFQNQTFAMTPFLDRTFYLDPSTHKVIVLYVDSVALNF